MIGWNTNLDSVRIYDTDEKRHMFMNKVPINELEEGRTYYHPRFQLPYYCTFERHNHKGIVSYKVQAIGDKIITKDTFWNKRAEFEDGDLYVLASQYQSIK